MLPSRSYCILILSFITHIYCNVYEIEQLENDSGLIIEEGPSVKLVRGHWKIVHYVDISELEKLKQNLYLGILELTEKCASQPHTLMFLTHLDTLSRKLEKLGNVTNGITSLLTKRSKRDAPFSFIGTVNKALFGTLDENDLADINTILNDHTINLDNLKELFQNETIIVKQSFKDIHTTIKKMQEVYNDTTLKIMKIQNFTLSNLIKIEELNESLAIINSINLANNFIDSLKDDYNTLLNAILFAKNGNLHPNIISMEKIYTIAQKIISNRTNEKFPVTEMENYDNFVKSIDLKIQIENGKLLYVILVPFTNNQNYSLYHVLPHVVNLTFGFGYTKPVSNLYIINTKLQQFISITEQQFTKCRLITKTYVCYENYLINKLRQHSPCEIKLIFNIPIKDIKTCDVRITKENKNHWTQSLDVYKIFFSLPEEENIKIFCKNEKTSVRLKGFGTITLTESCLIESNDFKYTTPKTRTFISSATISPSLNLNIVEIILNILKFSPKTNSTAEKVDFLFMDTIDHELGITSTKLDDILKKAEQLKIRAPKYFEYYLGVPALTILSIIVFLLTMFKLRRKC